MPHRDIDHLVQALLPSAKEHLTRERTLHPFGSAMTPEGEMVTLRHGHGHTRERLKSMGEQLRAEMAAGEIRAGALCMSVHTLEPGRGRKVHAICIAVEHQNGEGLDYYVPYRRGWFGRYRFGRPFGQPRPSVLSPASRANPNGARAR